MSARVCLAALVFGAAPLAPQTPVFEAKVESVFVDVYVTDHGKPVANLMAKDFILTDEGVPQDASLADLRDMGSTLVLVLDASSSVAGDTLEELTAAARLLLASLTGRDDAALVSFAHGATLLHLPGPAGAVSKSLDDIRAEGGTSLYDAIYLCLRRSWSDKRPVLVVFTDGLDTTSWLEEADVLAAAQASTATVYAVGIEPDLARAVVPGGFFKGAVSVESPLEPLKSLADLTGGATWSVASSKDLRDSFAAIARTLSTRYLLRYEPRGVKREGTHRLKVAVKRRGLDVRFRREYTFGR